MTRPFSIFLDGIRFCAAMAVFLTHLAETTTLPLGMAGRFGHDAVILFFVLSGYVIAHTVDSRDRDLRTYATNRFARLWSVVLPALLLTFCLDSIRNYITPEPISLFESQVSHSVFPLVANALFVNQLWFLDISPWSNAPFWSLGFEFWYYVFYACISFLHGRLRFLGVVMIALVTGPKISIMLPIWYLGVVVYSRKSAPRESLGWLLFVGSIIGYMGYRWSALSQEFSVLVIGALGIEHHHLGMAAYFPSDYVVALLCAANFYGLRGIEQRIGWILIACEKPIRFLASFTFSLYLFHVPLLNLQTAILPKSSLISPLLTLAAVFLFGTVTERKKQAARYLLLKISDFSLRVYTRSRNAVRS